jgi:uncharacterized SAM-binding protein YcdF (DUF218 family)
MLRRAVSLVLIVWALGFVWFAVFLPGPAGPEKTDGIIVPTGGEGRIHRGLELLRQGRARRMLVSGVDREVRPREFAAEFGVSPALMACCITLGYESVDTRSNAAESARWIAAGKARAVRLVTTDWHMRRAAGELNRAAPEGTTIVRDAVPSKPSLFALFLEYHKLIFSRLAWLWDG